MRDDGHMTYRVAIVTLDSHAAGPAERVETRLARDFPGLRITVHAAAEWGGNPAALQAAKEAVAHADIVIANLLFLEEHVTAIAPDIAARREAADAVVGCIAAQEIVKLTKMGGLDMAQPASGIMALLKRLRGSNKPSASSGAKQMAMLRRLPRILKFIPGKAQDLRAYFLAMQYWLGGSDDNVEALVRFLIGRYATRADWRGREAPLPVEYPETGLYHPALKDRITEDPRDLPKAKGPTVGLLLMRSYVLSGDTAHYDAVIAAMEKRGLRVIPAFAAGLDGRPAIERFMGGIDALVSLTGFSLVGGPAYNDSGAAEEALAALDVPYVAAHPLEFQTLGEWSASGGLGPVETTMLIALPEIDGATMPTVFGGRHGAGGCAGCAQGCDGDGKAMAPCFERIDRLAARVERLAVRRRAEVAERKVAIALYGFPPNAGAVGSAAHLAVFQSLFNVLHAMKADGYDLDPPESVDALRDAILHGNAAQFGQQANVAARVSAEDIVVREPHLAEIEAQWGPAPGRHQSDGSGVFILGAQFGKVFVGVQPAFGYEGDPMRLLFEKGFAPTHAFSTFYRWVREDFGADTILHFGMHGALEFMPGKQAGMGGDCWPDRLIGDVPNVYLYAANNPSEATLAKRRSGAVIVSHLTPPLSAAGLYKGLLEVKETLARWRALPPDAPERGEIATLLAEQAAAVDLDGSDPDALWRVLMETEAALIPEGLHVVGQPPEAAARAEQLDLMPEQGRRDELDALMASDPETPALMRALRGQFIRPVPGGDLIRNPDILPTGRNMHAFDPFRMPTAFAMQDGARQMEKLLATHESLPRSVALVLWGSDNIKSDGGPIAQALALMGAKPRFDSYGRLAGADLVPLEELGRPRIDCVMTLSGIFRDLLPLQTRLLAEAAWLAACADEPLDRNYVRAHALAVAEAKGLTLEEAALRVFSNAEGAYGSNVNQLVDAGAWDQEDELADAYAARKCFAYGRDGKAAKQPELLHSALAKVELAYQNLESVELGVTTVDHYFDTLGGIARAVKRERGAEAPVYIGDQTRGDGKVRRLADQIALETRSRALNPKWFEGMLKHGAEGVRHIESHVTNTLGWSATTGAVDPWVYDRLSETFVLDEEMRRRLAELNPQAGARMAGRLLEAHDRAYWQPSEEVLEALQRGADELEDRLEGIEAAE
ncbi:magnesium chelatase subunit H [Pontivivens ytuae]|uniref:magnesium chelatase n=1 Tax=Pontivivens ytuae TaxID=2789856 RepID=A0A7S9LQI2_9RHOB|nr:magnesium chelatase subunit H [Pontivivens ytuae]QPH53446.1 magnesium chelatase subunit H [Pontivivens ytuae]